MVKMKRTLKIKYIKIIVIILVLLVLSCERLILGPEEKAPSPVVHESEFATLLDSLRYALDLPVLAAAIVTDTGIIEAEAVGCRRYAGPANVTNTDRFHLGSCTKSFTAILIGTLVDQGLVNWSTTIPEIFPEYSGSMRQEYKNVTVTNILSHSAGFIRDSDLSISEETNPTNGRIKMLEWALKQHPVQQRGTFLYSNLGYSIAGAIAEKLANRSYEDLIMENVIVPLEITTAGFGIMGNAGKEDQPLQHTPNHAPIIVTQNGNFDPFNNPAGGLYMSVKDWGKYAQWVLAIEAGRDQSLLSKESAYMLTTPAVSQGNGWYYAFGWGISDQDWAGGKSLQHNGSNGLNYATIWLASPWHFGILLMTNQGPIGDDWPLGPAFWRLLAFYQKRI